jgi:hypothetical protein
MLNIVHIHVDDTSDHVTIDVKYCKDSEYAGREQGIKDFAFDFSKEEFATD